jgi:hypothetical protein
MTTDSANANNPSTLLEEFVHQSRLSERQMAAVVGLILILFLVGVAYLAGVLANPFDVDFWRAGLLYPAIIMYIFWSLPILRRLRDNAIESFRPLVVLDDDDFERLLAEAPMFNLRLERLALVIGAAGGLLLLRPWDYTGLSRTWSFLGARSEWLILYVLIAGGLWSGVLGLGVFSSIASIRLFSRLQLHKLNINIFDLKPLVPIGHWSLGIAMVFIGGSALSLLFFPHLTPNVETLILYSMLILTPVLVFFLNMLSTRQTLVAAKKQKLDMARDNLAAASRALEQAGTKGLTEQTKAQLDSIAAWVTYEKRVKEVPEWPHTSEIRRNLALSTLLPIAVWIIQQLANDLLKKLVDWP